MKLIRNLPTRIINGRIESWAIFWCDFCKQEVEKQLSAGKICLSCGCQKNKLIGVANKGKKRTKSQIKNISESHIGQKAWNKGLTKETDERISNSMLGKYHTEETRLIMSIKKKGHTPWNKGISQTEETRRKNSEAHKGKIPWNKGLKGVQFGELAPNWQGGKSFEDYGIEFNKELKQFIKNRDLNICQTPDCMNTERLCVHHIDYDKKNNNPENLITLCNSCHAKTNGKNNRFFWVNYYKEIVGIYL